MESAVKHLIPIHWLYIILIYNGNDLIKGLDLLINIAGSGGKSGYDKRCPHKKYNHGGSKKDEPFFQLRHILIYYCENVMLPKL